jgi:ATP-dependent Lon protease
VILPARNKRDFDDIPRDARDRLEFIWAEQVDDAIRSALDEGVPPKT